MPEKDVLVSHFHSDEALRSRSVSDVVLAGRVDVPAPPARLAADWGREISERLALAPGDVEALSLPRARMRWPDYRQCVQAATDWTRTLGLQDLLPTSEIALMACRGARYHHDGVQYGGAAFCNLFLSEDQGLDVHFPATGQRVPLVRGTVLIFDTGQPHAVIERGSAGFDPAHFEATPDGFQVFLTWELPIDNAELVRVLRIDLDVETLRPADEAQITVNGRQAEVCPRTGRWLAC